MKKLGEGWQYTVYDLHNGRVLKKYNSPFRTSWIILKDVVPGEMGGIRKIPQYIHDLKRKAQISFDILTHKNLPAAWFGNFTRLHGLDYEQDKITPLHDVFAKASREHSKNTVDQFVKFNERLLSHGIVDKFFNISKNFGLDANGEMVLADIGELVEDEQKILKLRASRVWAVDYKLKWIRDKEVRGYFVEQMDGRFGIHKKTQHDLV
ncbi:hypothetical protein KBB27_00730 [Patescibacteria group bacterium]|nr:hypothetical protein [Patescibacteria group bacterium]